MSMEHGLILRGMTIIAATENTGKQCDGVANKKLEFALLFCYTVRNKIYSQLNENIVKHIHKFTAKWYIVYSTLHVSAQKGPHQD